MHHPSIITQALYFLTLKDFNIQLTQKYCTKYKNNHIFKPTTTSCKENNNNNKTTSSTSDQWIFPQPVDLAPENKNMN